jgi:hypothetical protein
MTVPGYMTEGVWVINWMIDPLMRGRGLGPVLMRQVSELSPLTLNVGSNSDAISVTTRMGWDDMGLLKRYVSVLDRDSVRLLLQTEMLSWPADHSYRPIQSSSVTVKKVLRFGDAVTALWDSLMLNVAGTRRSASFLNWRYAAHPVFSYRLFEAHAGNELCGIAVYHIENVRGFNLKIGRLVEFIAKPQVEDVLLQTVLSDAESQHAFAIDFFCSSARVSRALERNGFLSEGAVVEQLPVLFQPIDRSRKGIPFRALLKRLANRKEITDWYVTKSDGDQDRPN